MLKQTEKTRRTFLICSVRDASPEELLKLQKIVADLENKGYIVEYPRWRTDQFDDGIGYRICWDNRAHIILSNDVHIQLSDNSLGSWLDIGMAFSAEKPLNFLNYEEFLETESQEVDFLTAYAQNVEHKGDSELYNHFVKRREGIRKLDVIHYTWKPGMENDRAFLIDFGIAFMEKGLAERLGSEKYIMVENTENIKITQQKSPQNVLLQCTEQYHQRLESIV